jgi:Spx/MgsR family transcriptional regulator
MITVYGIPNCDTVKKARKWLEAEGIDFTFHDFRKDGLEEGLAADWIARLGADIVINKRGTTWRKLSDEQKNITSDAQAVALILESPAMIKRPVFDKDGDLYVGFKEDAQAFLKG